MKTRALHILFALFATNSIFAQMNPDIIWSKSYGGYEYEYANNVIRTNDGGYMVGGNVPANDSAGEVSGQFGGYDVWLLKLDSNGNLEWQKCYGGTNDDVLRSIKRTNDNGYIFCGETNSIDGDVTPTHPGVYEAWIVKLDSAGNIQWQKTYGGSIGDKASDIEVLQDGSFIFCGHGFSTDGDLSGNVNHGDQDVWIERIDSTGSLIWSKTFGSSSLDYPTTILSTSDNGFIISAETYAGDFDVSNCNFHGGSDCWILKLDSIGNIQWKHCYGGSNGEWPASIKETSEGGYIFSGSSASLDGDVTGLHLSNPLTSDYWIVKLNNLGILEWQKTSGGTKADISYSVIQAQDGNYVIAGYTDSHDGDVTYNHGMFNDAWLIKLNTSGLLLWQESYGGSEGDGALSMIEDPDGSLVFAGGSNSSDDDVTLNHSILVHYSDYWIAKLSASSIIDETIPGKSYIIFPNPAHEEVIIDNERMEIIGIEIVNILGEPVIRLDKINDRMIYVNLMTLASGIYFLTIKEKNKIYTRKIIIQ